MRPIVARLNPVVNEVLCCVRYCSEIRPDERETRSNEWYAFVFFTGSDVLGCKKQTTTKVNKNNRDLASTPLEK